MGLQNNEGYWKIIQTMTNRADQSLEINLQVTDSVGHVAGHMACRYIAGDFGKDVVDVTSEEIYNILKKRPEFRDAYDALNPPVVFEKTPEPEETGKRKRRSIWTWLTTLDRAS